MRILLEELEININLILKEDVLHLFTKGYMFLENRNYVKNHIYNITKSCLQVLYKINLYEIDFIHIIN